LRLVTRPGAHDQVAGVGRNCPKYALGDRLFGERADRRGHTLVDDTSGSEPEGSDLPLSTLWKALRNRCRSERGPRRDSPVPCWPPRIRSGPSLARMDRVSTFCLGSRAAVGGADQMSVRRSEHSGWVHHV